MIKPEAVDTIILLTTTSKPRQHPHQVDSLVPRKKKDFISYKTIILWRYEMDSLHDGLDIEIMRDY
jgi:hypothetical protein